MSEDSKKYTEIDDNQVNQKDHIDDYRSICYVVNLEPGEQIMAATLTYGITDKDGAFRYMKKVESYPMMKDDDE